MKAAEDNVKAFKKMIYVCMDVYKRAYTYINTLPKAECVDAPRWESKKSR